MPTVHPFHSPHVVFTFELPIIGQVTRSGRPWERLMHAVTYVIYERVPLICNVN